MFVKLKQFSSENCFVLGRARLQILFWSMKKICPKNLKISFRQYDLSYTHKQARGTGKLRKAKLNVKTVIKVNLWKYFLCHYSATSPFPWEPWKPPGKIKIQDSKFLSIFLAHIIYSWIYDTFLGSGNIFKTFRAFHENFLFKDSYVFISYKHPYNKLPLRISLIL